jgi:hypothetical protein
LLVTQFSPVGRKLGRGKTKSTQTLLNRSEVKGWLNIRGARPEPGYITPSVDVPLVYNWPGVNKGSHNHGAWDTVSVGLTNGHFYGSLFLARMK